MDTFDTQTPFGKALLMVVVAIFGTLLYEAVLADHSAAVHKPKQNQYCEGTPIRVDYAYYGGMIAPHACLPQCDTSVQRYVLYSNGRATQCQKLPGCLDWGEDQGVTCIPPTSSA